MHLFVTCTACIFIYTVIVYGLMIYGFYLLSLSNIKYQRKILQAIFAAFGLCVRLSAFAPCFVLSLYPTRWTLSRSYRAGKMHARRTQYVGTVAGLYAAATPRPSDFRLSLYPVYHLYRHMSINIL